MKKITKAKTDNMHSAEIGLQMVRGYRDFVLKGDYHRHAASSRGLRSLRAAVAKGLIIETPIGFREPSRKKLT